MQKKFRMHLFILSALAIFCVASSCRASSTEINEPVFGYSYSLSQASFPKIRLMNFGSPCFELAKKDFSLLGKIKQQVYLYGEYRNSDVCLRIVGDARGTAIYVQRGENCGAANPVIAFLQRGVDPLTPKHTPYLSQQEIEGVFADLLRRYAAAFGGKEKFFAWLDPLTKSGLYQCRGMSQAFCHPTWHDLPTNLQEMLQKFRTSS